MESWTMVIGLIVSIAAIVGTIVPITLSGLGKLDRKIDGVESRLTERIDGVESRLTERIDGVESRLTERMDRIEARVDARADGLEVRIEKLDDRVYALAARIGPALEPPVATRESGEPQRASGRKPASA